jgi:hypothetical protein
VFLPTNMCPLLWVLEVYVRHGETVMAGISENRCVPPFSNSLEDAARIIDVYDQYGANALIVKAILRLRTGDRPREDPASITLSGKGYGSTKQKGEDAAASDTKGSTSMSLWHTDWKQPQKKP